MNATLLDQRSITIEYLPTEKEMDPRLPLEVGTGISGKSINITELLGSRDYFATTRFLTNLDPIVVDYDETLTSEQKEAKKARINEDVLRLEKVFGKGTLDATNKAFWSKVYLQITKKTTNMDLSNPKNELVVNCIKAGGFTTVAATLEEALDTGKKFYLIEPIEFVENRVSPRRLINKAIEELQKLDNDKPENLFYIAKYILPAEKGYTKKTPRSLMYEDLDKYINGELIKETKTRLANRFLEVAKKSKKELISYALVKDAAYFGFLYVTPAGEFKNNETGGIYGTSLEKAGEHITNAAYSQELDNVRERVEQKWSE